MTGAIPWEFGNLVNLKNLNLSHPLLDGTIPDSFGHLEVLDISSAMLTAIFLERCQTLEDDQDNKLSGHLPLAIGLLTSLEFLDLSHNQLCGEIPDSVLRFASVGSRPQQPLQQNPQLHLSHKQLSGEIPVGVAMLPALMDLSLNNNNLVGPLHRGIGALRRVINLDVSYNQLTGTVPKRVLKLRSNTRKLDHNQILGLLRVWMRGINSQEIAAVDQGVPDRASRAKARVEPLGLRICSRLSQTAQRSANALVSMKLFQQVAAARRLIEQARNKANMFARAEPASLDEQQKPFTDHTCGKETLSAAEDVQARPFREPQGQGQG
ncbi:hypothetical protein CcCBS67573_g09226 [Chytriomyces confervae]|uniref:Uncharacterized protein n=1 Tax=Chytriomyces confervae TaxID=246404 RepID=A0A507E1H7_9FUNG|nr:hypothetical protein CcCBS67573_g09226 [Chytriomyces confervae]